MEEYAKSFTYSQRVRHVLFGDGYVVNTFGSLEGIEALSIKFTSLNDPVWFWVKPNDPEFQVLTLHKF